jgi:hypothetical protein
MYIRFPSMILGMALFGALLLPSVQADDWNKKTVITITEPVQMPNCCTPDHTVTLQPGTYVLVLVDSLSDRHIVRVFEKDEKTVVTTILAIPNYRLQPTGETHFQFWETPAGQPRAMRAWFYPGDNFGQEFAYPKTTSVAIAKVANAPVPTVTVEKEAELKTAPLVAVDQTGIETPLKVEAPPVVAAADRAAPEPAPPVAVSAPEPTPAPTPAPTPTPVAAPDPAPASLPNTSSPFPLLGLIGLGSLAFSGIMSRFSKRG